MSRSWGLVIRRLLILLFSHKIQTLDLIDIEIWFFGPFWPIFGLFWALYKPLWTRWFLRVFMLVNQMFCEFVHTIYWPKRTCLVSLGVFSGLLEELFWMSFVLIRCGCCVFWGTWLSLYWLLLVLTGHYWQPCKDVLYSLPLCFFTWCSMCSLCVLVPGHSCALCVHVFD